MFEDLPISTQMGFWGLAIGIALGFVVHRTNFCAMGAVSDIVSFSDWRRMRAWVLAMAVGIIGSQLLYMGGYVALDHSIYLRPSLSLSGLVIGGLIFGFGMVLGGGCPGRNLMRVGNGDLKALVVLFFIGWAGYMTMRGVLYYPQSWVRDALVIDLKGWGLPDQGVGTILGAITGLEGAAMQMVAMLAIGGALAAFALKDAGFRRSPRHLAAGILLGLLVTLAWFATGYMGADDFEPAQVTALTFIAPTGDAFQYLMTWTGATINFGIATVGGVILGSFISSKMTKTFHLSTFVDTPDTVRNMVGGALMGFGGILALGCTFGQGITGISTLAIGSLLATAAIMAGGVLGVKYMERVLDI